MSQFLDLDDLEDAYRQDKVKRQETEIASLQSRLAAAERLLCDLTPSGSEFAGDPQRCHDWVRDRMSSLTRMLVESKAAEKKAEQQSTAERQQREQAEALCAELRTAMQRAIGKLNDTSVFTAAVMADAAIRILDAALARTPEQAGERWMAERDALAAAAAVVNGWKGGADNMTLRSHISVMATRLDALAKLEGKEKGG